VSEPKTPAEQAIERGQPVHIERVANGFIVRQSFAEFGDDQHRVRATPPLVFNDLAGKGSLLDWLASHFESEADRKARLERAHVDEIDMRQRIAEMLQPTLVGPAYAGFPPISEANEQHRERPQGIVAYEFRHPNGHAIVDYSEHTPVGRLSAEKGYVARPLVYAPAAINPAPFDGSLLKTEHRAYACSARANGLPLCRKWCGNEVLCSAASSDAGSPT
jgi:hypothetical protein